MAVDPVIALLYALCDCFIVSTLPIAAAVYFGSIVGWQGKTAFRPTTLVTTIT